MHVIPWSTLHICWVLSFGINFQLSIVQDVFHLQGFIVHTLDSGIDVAPGINVAHGTFGKNIKGSP